MIKSTVHSPTEVYPHHRGPTPGSLIGEASISATPIQDQQAWTEVGRVKEGLAPEGQPGVLGQATVESLFSIGYVRVAGQPAPVMEVAPLKAEALNRCNLKTVELAVSYTELVRGDQIWNPFGDGIRLVASIALEVSGQDVAVQMLLASIETKTTQVDGTSENPQQFLSHLPYYIVTSGALPMQ
jgi:hypothetical protein